MMIMMDLVLVHLPLVVADHVRAICLADVPNAVLSQEPDDLKRCEVTVHGTHGAEKHADRGMRLLFFPCNQFCSEEPGTAADIKSFYVDKHGLPAASLMEAVAVASPSLCSRESRARARGHKNCSAQGRAFHSGDSFTG